MRGSRDRGGGEAGAFSTLSVRVTPRSSKNAVAGFSGGVLKVRLTAPPVDDRANEALVRFLSGELDVPPRHVEILSGERGRNKVVRIHGLPLEEALRRLCPPSEEPAD